LPHRAIALVKINALICILVAAAIPAIALPQAAQQRSPDNVSQETVIPAQTPVKTAALNNKNILSMVKGRLSSEIIVAKIKSSACDFDTSPTALAESKKAGVSDAIILAMVQAPTAPAWFFEEWDDNNGKRPTHAQALTVQVKNLTEFSERGVPAPKLSIVCKGRDNIGMWIFNAGIFRTTPGRGYEESDVEYRFEFDDTSATSFLQGRWVKVDIKDAIYDNDRDFIHLMFLSRRLLVKLQVEGGAPTARFDITGFREQIPKMTVCSKELNKIDKSLH
jgi:hypothetical protein